MKKPNPKVENLLRIKREGKRLRRKNKRKIYRGEVSVFDKEQRFQIEHDEKIIGKYHSKVYEFLLERGFITGNESRQTKISIPSVFSLCDNYEDSLQAIRDMVFAMWKNAGKNIELDFSKCSKVDQSALFLLQILRLELLNELLRLDRNLQVLTSKITFNIVESKNETVNFNLLLCGFLSNIAIKGDLVPIDTIGYIKGVKSQKHYLENKKGVIGTRVVSYLNKCLINSGYMLTAKGKNELGNMIGEILNNAEDHSPTNTYYVTANYYIDKGDTSNGTDNTVGVLNLSFMNFGYSIYEGLV